MRKKIVIAAGALAALAALVGAGFLGAVWLGERKLERRVYVKVVPVPFATGVAALKQGKYLFESRGCAECHGPDGSGRLFVDSPNGLYAKSPNITRGPGGVVDEYTEADWVRAVRHGVDPKGRALLVMPSEDYNRLHDADLAALVAYTRSLPPIAGGPAVIRLPRMLKALYGLGAIRDASEKIDHALAPAQPVPVAANVEHGRYVAQMCIGCHGVALTGGRMPGRPPDWPPAANLTPGEGSAMLRYDTPEKFAAMMRTGKRPDGSDVSKVMPFETLRAFNDTDLAAMYAYLRTLEPKTAGGR